MIKATLCVDSRDLSTSQISEVLGRAPDTAHERGSLSPLRKVPREESCWELELALPPEVHDGTEGLAAAIEALGRPLAQRLAELDSLGCWVVVSVIQELTDDSVTHGLHLTPGAIGWLATAGAILEVDQYVDL